MSLTTMTTGRILSEMRSLSRNQWTGNTSLVGEGSNPTRNYNFLTTFDFDSSDGRVERAPASEAADSGLTPSRVKPMTLKSILTASLLALKGECGEQAGKFTCCAVGKALSGITPSWCGRQMAENSLASSLRRFDGFLVKEDKCN